MTRFRASSRTSGAHQLITVTSLSASPPSASEQREPRVTVGLRGVEPGLETRGLTLWGEGRGSLWTGSRKLTE